MPDWFYRTVSQRFLFSLPGNAGRDLALGVMGTLARIPGGAFAIDFLGHMSADKRLSVKVAGDSWPTRIGLGRHLDPRGGAGPALARFGFGFIEFGPVAGESHPGEFAVRRDRDESLALPDSPAMFSPQTAVAWASETPREIRRIARLATGISAGDAVAIVKELGPSFDVIVLDESDANDLTAVSAAAHESDAAIWIAIAADATVDDRKVDGWFGEGAGGLFIDGEIVDADGCRVHGRLSLEAAKKLVVGSRRAMPDDATLAVNGGAHEPADVLALIDAGADLVALDTGLLYRGPGLAKRTNEALLDRLLTAQAQREGPETEDAAPSRPAARSWFWTLGMGLGLLAGSVVALFLASTSVLLPYDEAFLGLSRAEIAAINPKLLPFMAHDRVSLAGTMIAVGAMYAALSWGGSRRGIHWAQQAIFWSAFTGFPGFLLFLGFGYFDPFHAFITLVLFQLFVMGVHADLGPPSRAASPFLNETPALRRAWWGQLLLVIHGVALLVAGLVISTIGATSVFVQEDLNFMETTAAALRAAHPRLVPLIAHDRATFGAMLVASGWVFLLPALWGIREGSAWLWWPMTFSGAVAYVLAILVHCQVGYADWRHLAPAFGGLAVFLLGAGLVSELVCSRGRSVSGEA